jgi:hypothetical protein
VKADKTVMSIEAFLSAARAAAAHAAKPVPVQVPGFGTVYVRPLTVQETEANVTEDAKAPQEGRFARGLARLICDEKGHRLFNPPSAEVVKLLSEIPWQQLQPLMDAGQVDTAGVDAEGN